VIHRLIPSIEFAWLKNIDFFPARPNPVTRIGEFREICIGTKSRNLGDALALSSLPGKLRARYPDLRVTTYPRGFNPVVFEGNPHVTGVSYLPDRVWGDDCNEGAGQLIQRKEQFFGLDSGPESRPEIHLSTLEWAWARRFVTQRTFVENATKPLVVIHPWGNTNSEIAPVEFWDEVIRRWKDRIRFWQVGIYKQGAVQGCEYYFFQEPARWNARRLFALVSQAHGFMGVDSGPMHVARAFSVSSCVLTNASLIEASPKTATLYPANKNVEAHDLKRAAAELDEYFGRVQSLSWKH